VSERSVDSWLIKNVCSSYIRKKRENNKGEKMTSEMVPVTKTAVFRQKEIRKTIHNNEWRFVVEDVVVALTDSVNPKDYINKMRRRDEELSKGYGQFVHTLSIDTLGCPQKPDEKSGYHTMFRKS
jgi:hypothetical protein